MMLLTARRGGTSTPRRAGLTNGHVNGVSSPAAVQGAQRAESSLFSSPAPRRGLFAFRVHCTSLTKWLTRELTIWLSVDAMHETLTFG